MRRRGVNVRCVFTDGERSRPFHVAGLAAAAEAFDEFVVVAPPGTGKSTTLLQVAETIVASGRSVGLFVPLGEWSVGGGSLLASVAVRHAFRGVSEADLALLAEHGRLVLALDGWNELDSVSRRRVTAELGWLKRDYPQLGLVVSTRREALDVPVGGRVIEIEYLNEEQQRIIARAYRGDAGETLLDAAWRTPGIRDLVAIPLYLTALLIAVKDDHLPATREEVLRLFIRQHDDAPERARALREVAFGFHGDMLKALAVEATQTANTSIGDSVARTVVKGVEDQLAAGNQITFAPQPTAILDVLVSQHTLIRSGTESVSFQHQQFQEWYASFEAERAMREAALGGAEAVQRLRAEILDERNWEKSLLFACERVSREDGDGPPVVARAIRVALTVDPILAAEMIFRSSDAVWREVADDVSAFVKQWHEPGQVDRAVRFMATSGRPEFAATFWPFMESTNSQVYLSVTRVARRFRPSVLGANADKRLAAIPEATRGHVLAELVMYGTVEAIGLAAGVAKADSNQEVQMDVIQALLFRRADKRVAELLSGAPDAIWDQLAKKDYDETEIRYPEAEKELAKARARLAAAAGQQEKIGILLRRGVMAKEDVREIENALASKEFPARDQHASSTLYRVAERMPDVAGRAMLRRLEAGLELPFRAHEYLTAVPAVDDGAIAALILDQGTEEPLALAATRAAGPKTTRELLDRLVSAAGRLHAAPENARQEPSKELNLWLERLVVVPAASVIAALLSRDGPDPPQVIGALAEVVARHGSNDQEKPPLDVGTSGDKLTALAAMWTTRVLADKDSRRQHLAWVGRAIARLARPELLDGLKALRNEDARRRSELRAQVRTPEGRANIHLRSDAATSWNHWYRDSFAQMGEPVVAMMIGYLDDEDFGFDAAVVLKTVDDGKRGVEKSNLFKTWPYFDGVSSRRAERAAADPRGGDTAPAEAIFAAIERLIAEGSSSSQQKLAIKLARIAISMPYGDQDVLIARLLALSEPAGKRELVAAIVMDGGTFSPELGLAAVDAWVARVQKENWRLREELWEVIGWLELLPFSDRPGSVRDGLERVSTVPKHSERMDRVVTAMAEAPGISDAELGHLFSRFPGMVSQHEWAQAFLGRKSPAAVRLLVEFVASGRMGRGPGAVDVWWLAREIAAAAGRHPELKGELIDRFEKAAPGNAYHLLERTLENIAGPEAVLALVRSYGRDGRSFGGSLPQTLYHTALDHVPLGEGSNAFNLVPVSLASLRKELFGMISNGGPLAAVASETLEHIDRLRDEHGAADGEPRHPDVGSGQPWPPHL